MAKPPKTQLKEMIPTCLCAVRKVSRNVVKHSFELVPALKMCLFLPRLKDSESNKRFSATIKIKSVHFLGCKLFSRFFS